MSEYGPDDFNGTLEHGDNRFSDTDLLLIAMLQDPVISPEFCWKDSNNVPFSGCYRVRDYQVAFNRADDHYAGFACARSVGKTERQKVWAFTHYFRRAQQNLLITAPELLHLMPLADSIENVIDGCRLLRECLDRSRSGKTGFHHNPFGVDYADGTKIIGRIPNRDGRGVKGQHQPDLMIEEAQDYPDAGWTEVHETVMKEVSDFHYHFYGVHRGVRGGGFSQRVTSGDFALYNLTALQRPGWGPEEKAAAIAAYGGESSPDYRRNILGEPGSASSPIFVTARLMACVDQNRNSHYNQTEYVSQHFRWEEIQKAGMELEHVIDFPGKKYKNTIAGIDIGLTNSPTVCVILGELKHGKTNRLGIIRRFTLERFTSKQIRKLVRLIYQWDNNIQGIGMDITGIGFPIFQELQEDEDNPDPTMLSLVKGWKFNEKIRVGEDKNTGDEIKMTVIEATTRYLREWVDSGQLLIPFDREITSDMLGEHQQRVQSVARLTGSRKPNAFHTLDALRMAALVDRAHELEVASAYQAPVFDIAIEGF